ncbi:hypothetical protein BLS_001238 [Venturia inaequalis]|uniref:Uncharacterized protein n=1 Tax=Venturia inaequalis TaxID=5025 RepID=A0A8H3UDU7_VENIN|nr:hypothetical protein EG328_008525 [Venturia inaequalis]KAE9977618.1 hypothetical protein BLS_001238 [Venturia inaequalis]KAE9991204.1 hypothetical protein EG327_000325 [Venturia inaequalis]
MKLTNTQLAVAIASFIPLCSAYPKLIIAGGTNVAPKISSQFSELRGWTGYIDPLLNVSVISSQTIPNASVRTTFQTGSWERTMRLLKKDDFVVLEYGLDDEGDPQNKPKNGSLNLRASLPGTGDETVTVRYEVIDTVQLPNGTTQVVKGSARNVTEVVHTFGWYLKNMIVDVRDQEAHVIISSRIPNNWETVKAAGNKTIDTLATEYKLRDYAQKVAEEIKAEFVDHTYYTLRYLQELGPVESKKLYGYRPEPGQEIEKKLYTNVKGAKATAQTFIQALICSGSDLVSYLSNDGLAVDKVIC